MSLTEQQERDLVVAEAMTWIGTRFHDCAAIKARRAPDGTITDRGGTDCATSMPVIFHNALPHRVPRIRLKHYSPQHMMHKKADGSRPDEIYLNEVLKWAHEIPREQVKPADIVLMRIGWVFAHGAIVIPPGLPHIVHADSEAREYRQGTITHVRLAANPMKFFTLW